MPYDRSNNATKKLLTCTPDDDVGIGNVRIADHDYSTSEKSVKVSV